MAVGISKIAATGQKRENMGFGNAVSQGNAINAVKAAQAFIKAVVIDTKQNYDKDMFDFDEANGERFTSKSKAFSINQKTGVPLNDQTITKMYQGVEAEGNGTDSINQGNPKIFYSTAAGDVELWYRNNDVWGDQVMCPTCVDVNGDQSSIYRIEKRAFAGTNTDIASSGSKIGYQFYRVTARGIDPATRSTTILQTHIGILSSDSGE